MAWFCGDDDKYPHSGNQGSSVNAMKLTTFEVTTQPGSGTTNPIPGLSKYFTVSEICDHRDIEDAWIIEPDNDFGFDVYDISGT